MEYYLDLGWCFWVVHRHLIECRYLDRGLICSVVGFAGFAAWLKEGRREEEEARPALSEPKAVMMVEAVERMVQEER